MDGQGRTSFLRLKRIALATTPPPNPNPALTMALEMHRSVWRMSFQEKKRDEHLKMRLDADRPARSYPGGKDILRSAYTG